MIKTLYYKEGSSDKVYQVEMTEQPAGHIVVARWGRRGAALQSQTKGTSLTREKAFSMVEKLVREKTSKGYSEGEGGTKYEDPDKEETEFKPQLLNEVSEAEAMTLLIHPEWLTQEKKDGHRRAVICKEGKVTGANRRGTAVPLQEHIVNAVRLLNTDVILDGELVGDVYYPFDMLFCKHDMRYWPYRQRLQKLLETLYGHFILPVSANSQQEKETMFNALQTSAEGIVFKRKDAPFKVGRPNSGGDQLKYKFWATASVIVGKINEKRSVQVSVISPSGPLCVGNVSIPANHEIPKVGDVVEVRYLYAHPEGSLFQPQYQGTRNGEIDPIQCTVSQLKYKP